ncbi:MFS transporter [Paraferrimonas sp. SM1919]|uniref:MFS transporter n=1 Tax=Paraferrimonas sp. SM1919 TaxID=2662263 RepID=UPI0013D27014|nr:MFS transporter [Paraferrimonas sp. SM1919]
MTRLAITEKIGYAAGDAAANLVWRGALTYLAVFYTDVFGLTAAAAAALFLIVRLTDGITDIIVGMLADRSNSRWGKFRPWVLFSSPLLALFMVMSFTTPEFSQSGKLAYAYFTYIGLTLFYTLNNVPYSAMMGVMTDDQQERTSLSSYRFAGAFVGGIFVMGLLPEFVKYFGQGNEQLGYQYTMYLFALMLLVFMLITFVTTKERVVTTETPTPGEFKDLFKNLPFVLLPFAAISLFFYYRDLVTGIICAVALFICYVVINKLKSKPQDKLSKTQLDFIDLLSNRPWLILIGMGFLLIMYTGIRYGVAAYYFKYIINNETLLGYYFITLLVISIPGALATNKLSKVFGKKALFAGSLALSGFINGFIFWVQPEQIELLFVLGSVSEFFAAITPALYFAMLGDSADYSEWKTGRRATGLVYSAGTFIQKTGGGFAGALILLILANQGYNSQDSESIHAAKDSIIWLMSWIPSIFAFIGASLILFYPISGHLMNTINSELAISRKQ